MTNFNLENLFFTATEREDDEIIDNLLKALSEQDNLLSDEIASGLDFLMEAWGTSIETKEVKAKFCLDLALMAPPDSPAYRISLQRAFNCLKTSPFMKSAVVKATGVRDEQIPIKNIAERFIIIENLKPGTALFNPKSARLGKVEGLDEITSEIIVRWDTANSSTIMGLQTALNDLIFLAKSPALPKITGKAITDSSSEWRENFRKEFISLVDDATIKQVAFSIIIDSGITNENFEIWWNATDEDSSDEQPKERHPSTARTLHELNILLVDYDAGNFSEEELVTLKKTFKKLKLKSTPANMLMFAESLAMLKNYIPEEKLVEIAESVKEQVTFWPHPPDASNDKLAAWEKLSAKYLASIALLTSDIFSDEYMASLLLLLSYRCWNSVVPVVDIEVLADTLENAPFLSADAILWIWKNRTKLPETTVAEISPQALRKALDTKGSSAIQEVKQLFIDDKTFQKELIARIKGKEMDLLRAIQACDNLRMDEKQSLLVKCSAISPEVKYHIEKGDGKKMFAAAGRKHAEKKSDEEADITSIKSFNAMAENLNDIITRQLPENSAAIAHARSYGDLKENAEYKAAKERQAYLQRRRDEIDQSIIRTQPVDFSLQKVDNVVIPGSTVTISYRETKEEETFHLLGVWDSNPDKNCIAYTTGLGKALNGKMLNDEVVLPDGRNAVIVKLEPLPSELLDELNVE
jgi:transcription elongation GreA/GreB family factor